MQRKKNVYVEQETNREAHPNLRLLAKERPSLNKQSCPNQALLASFRAGTGSFFGFREL